MDGDSKKVAWYKSKTIKSIIAIIVAMLIGFICAKLGVTDFGAVEAVKTVVVKTINEEEITDEEATKATTGALVITTQIVQEQGKKAAEKKVETKVTTESIPAKK